MNAPLSVAHRRMVAGLIVAEPSDSPSVEVFELEAAGTVRRVATAVGNDPLACPLTAADLTPAGLAPVSSARGQR